MKNLKMSIAAMLLLAVSFTNAQEKETANNSITAIFIFKFFILSVFFIFKLSF
jgi:hypothetical protein